VNGKEKIGSQSTNNTESFAVSQWIRALSQQGLLNPKIAEVVNGK
jgi:hypothetical protein